MINKNITYAQQRIKNTKLMRNEHLVLLAMLYGYYFDQGTKSFEDFKHLRMKNIESELRIRTQVLTNEFERKRKQQEKAKEQAIAEKKAKEIAWLKSLQNG